MKKLLLSAVMLTSIIIAAKAQDEDGENKPQKQLTPSEANFSMPDVYINIRDYVYLANKTKMIIELNNTEQYRELKTLDETIDKFLADIAFYKDSLQHGGGSVRIDYTIDESYPFSKIRFKKHPADGDIFMHSRGDIAKLKLDQDTVHIYVRHNPVLERPNNTRKDWAKNYKYNYNNARFYQVTFCLNHYTDLKKIADDSKTLQHALDTLMATKNKSTKQNPHNYPSSTIFSPFGPDSSSTEGCNACKEKVRFKKYNGLANESGNWKDVIQRSDILTVNANFGMGMVRNAFAPYSQVGFSLIRYGRRMYNGNYSRTYWNVFTSVYYMFERDGNNEFILNDNMFVNASFRSGYMNSAIGAGYLISGKGSYFKGPTAKVFLDVTLLKKGLTLSPELIITNNFEQAFMGLTLKVF